MKLIYDKPELKLILFSACEYIADDPGVTYPGGLEGGGGVDESFPG